MCINYVKIAVSSSLCFLLSKLKIPSDATFKKLEYKFLCSVQFSHSVVSNSLHPMDCSMPGFPVHHQLPELAQVHARLPCPSPAPGACSSSCPSSRCCHPVISSSVVPSPPAFSFRVFPISQFFASGGQSIGASASASVLPMNIQD